MRCHLPAAPAGVARRASRLATSLFLLACWFTLASCSESSTTGPEAARHLLRVLLSGPGQGSVTSAPAGIDCRSDGGTCEAQFEAGTSVTLTATGGQGFQLGGWSGDGEGDDRRTITMDRPRTVTAEFVALPPPELHVPGQYPTIQQAIAAASPGDEVVVAPGTYVGTIDFQGKGIVVRGSAPLDPAVVEGTVLDGGGSGPVVRIENVTQGRAILMGFTIQNGVAERGGGIYVENATPTLINLVVRNNHAKLGGGGLAMLDAHYPVTEEVTAADAEALSPLAGAVAGPVAGSGAAALGPGAPLGYHHYSCGIDPRTFGPVKGCIRFHENTTAGRGGGLSIERSRLNLMLVHVTHNTAAQGCGGGEVRNSGGLIGWTEFGHNIAQGFGPGGALCADREEDEKLEVPLTLSGNKYEWNIGYDGGGLWAKGPPVREEESMDSIGRRFFGLRSWNSRWENNTAGAGSAGVIIRTEGAVVFQNENGVFDVTIRGGNVFLDNSSAPVGTTSAYVRWDQTMDAELNLTWSVGRPVAGSASMLTQIRHGIIAPAESGCPGYHLHGGQSGIQHWGTRGGTPYQWHGPYADPAPQNCGFGRVYGGGFGAEPLPDG